MVWEDKGPAPTSYIPFLWEGDTSEVVCAMETPDHILSSQGCVQSASWTF